MRQLEAAPSREPAPAKARLVKQPRIEIVAPDRGGGYAQAAAQALPHADQVADRWHLLENATTPFRAPLANRCDRSAW
ncbi:transposase [Martelella soudanensis]|uniref:transposase n=1 Tax=Martelella sp. NC20 TaxID=2740298 RepID=UPI0015DD80FA